MPSLAPAQGGEAGSANCTQLNSTSGSSDHPKNEPGADPHAFKWSHVLVAFAISASKLQLCLCNHQFFEIMRIVLDTSVLVAAARSRNGASYQLVSMLPSSRFNFALTIALYTEWQAVLTRPEHIPPGVSVEGVQEYLRYLVSLAHHQDVHFLWRPFLHDPDDDMVLECAVASGSQYIVTHNVKDFRRVPELKVQAITPADFLTLLRS